MPAPTVVVVFVDVDGDEFPVRVPAVGDTRSAAWAVAEQLCAEGVWRPTEDLQYLRTEVEKPTMEDRARAARDGGVMIGLVLAEVRDMGPITVLNVAGNLGIAESSARRLLKQLEESGLIESDDYQLLARVFIATGKEG